MKLFVLYWRLLRYRVAVMILLFMLLGAAWQGGPGALGFPVFLMAFALASSYVSATSVNDIADREIDQINHPKDEGRPLVTGAAGTADLWTVFVAASVLAVILPLAVGLVLAGIMALSLGIGVVYSLPPLKLSYRTFLAPLTLAFAYVGVPYWAGAVAAGGGFEARDLPLLAALYLLFVGRIVLKDFRDREGDAAYGKPTFLLKYGKHATCLLSLGAVCAGDVMLIAALWNEWWLAVLLQMYIAGVAIMLLRLYRSKEREGEQLAIGVGAKLGNGLLITLLGAVILATQNAGWAAQISFCLALMAFYGITFTNFLRNPERAVIGYKG